MARASAASGREEPDLSFITDGLRAEREQGITIDVAFRFFATPRRRFTIIDCPGHEQYVRNMISGASHADLIVLLIDARRGLTEQTRRHAFLASLLRIPHVIVCVNKMDLVNYSEEAFDEAASSFADYAARLGFGDLEFVPISALNGDNVVERSERMAWYQGPPLLYQLEHVHVSSDRNLVDVRFPVQMVVRDETVAGRPRRWCAGRVASGVLHTGDEIVVLPSGRTTRVAEIRNGGETVPDAFAPMSALVALEDDVDVGRGDLVCRPHNRPESQREIEAMVCWLAEDALGAGGDYLLMHTANTVTARVEQLRYRIDLRTLHRDETAQQLAQNDIGRIQLRTSAPLLCDPYFRNREMGSFILVERWQNATVGAGTILGMNPE